MNEEVTSTESKNKLRLMWENLELSICLVTMVAMTVIVFAQVVGRYLFSYSFGWSEEIARFLVIWVTFGGSAYAFRKGAHIGVTAVVEALPKNLRFYVNIISRILTIIFFIVLGYYGLEHTLNQYALGQLAPATRLSVAIPYSAIPIGSFLVILRLLDQSIQDIKARRRLEVEKA